MKYYIAKKGFPIKGISLKMLEDLIREGVVQGDDLVFSWKHDVWITVREIEKFRHVFESRETEKTEREFRPIGLLDGEKSSINHGHGDVGSAIQKTLSAVIQDKTQLIESSRVIGKETASKSSVPSDVTNQETEGTSDRYSVEGETHDNKNRSQAITEEISSDELDLRGNELWKPPSGAEKDSVEFETLDLADESDSSETPGTYYKPLGDDSSSFCTDSSDFFDLEQESTDGEQVSDDSSVISNEAIIVNIDQDKSMIDDLGAALIIKVTEMEEKVRQMVSYGQIAFVLWIILILFWFLTVILFANAMRFKTPIFGIIVNLGNV